MSRNIRKFPLVLVGVISSGALVLSACAGNDETQPATQTNTTSTSEELSGDVTLITHESFHIPDEVVDAFEKETGVNVTITSTGDGGQLANQLVLTKDAPLADAFYGVDNSFITSLIDAGAVEPYQPAGVDLPTEFAADDQGSVTPIDYGYVCVNVDNTWFDKQNVAAPQTFDDLLAPEYQGKTVVMDPTASSPGAAMLFATVAKYGSDGYLDYWKDLLANDAKVVQGWSDAYYADFTGASEDGTYPIVVSYNTSPAYTVSEDGDESTTSALLDTCTRQIEYAGVLAGSQNPAAARALVDLLVSQEFQDSIAENMYMYPVLDSASVPDEWESFAPIPNTSYDVPPAELAQNRTTWLDEWSQIAS